MYDIINYEPNSISSGTFGIHDTTNTYSRMTRLSSNRIYFALYNRASSTHEGFLYEYPYCASHPLTIIVNTKTTLFMKNLKKLRLERGLSQQKLADILHITQQSIYKYENGLAEPNIELLKNIADYFIYRYFLKAVYDGDIVSKSGLCAFACIVINGISRGGDITECARAFSKEVEYSDLNISAVLNQMKNFKILRG